MKILLIFFGIILHASSKPFSFESKRISENIEFDLGLIKKMSILTKKLLTMKTKSFLNLWSALFWMKVFKHPKNYNRRKTSKMLRKFKNLWNSRLIFKKFEMDIFKDRNETAGKKITSIIGLIRLFHLRWILRSLVSFILSDSSRFLVSPEEYWQINLFQFFFKNFNI